MESADVTPNPKPGDDALEQMLRRPPPALPGDAFTCRVLGALPSASTENRRSPARTLVIAFSAIAGLALAATAAVDGGLDQASARHAVAEVHASLGQVAEAIANPNVNLALVVAVLSVAFAFASDSLASRFRLRK